MSGSPDAGAEREPSAWLLVAAAILGFEGVTTILYAGFLTPPLTDAGIDVPLLGHLPFVWLVIGGLALVAAVGVARRRMWGRYLGTLSVAVTLAGLVGIAAGPANAIIALVLPLIVLFALWRRWPTPVPG